MLRLPPPLKNLLRGIDQRQAVDALAAIHARQTQRQVRQRVRPDDEATLDRLGRILRRRDERLGHERNLVDALLDQLTGEAAGAPKRSGAPLAESASGDLGSVPQQEVLLQAERGQRAGGRFRIWNGGDRTATFSFRVGVREDGTAAPPIAFAPGAITVGPRSAAAVRVQVDLAEERDADDLTIAVDVCTERTLSQRLWIVVHVS